MVVDSKLLGWKNLITIVNKVYEGESKRKKCVDYILAGLVNDNMRTLHQLVDGEEPFPELRKFLMSQLTAMGQFFKYSYSSHICSISDVYIYI